MGIHKPQLQKYLVCLLFTLSALGQEGKTFETIVPRACMISVTVDQDSLKDCKIVAEIAPDSECVLGDDGKIKNCNGFTLRLTECKPRYNLTRHTDCEDIRVIQPKPPDPK